MSFTAAEGWWEICLMNKTLKTNNSVWLTKKPAPENNSSSLVFGLNSCASCAIDCMWGLTALLWIWGLEKSERNGGRRKKWQHRNTFWQIKKMLFIFKDQHHYTFASLHIKLYIQRQQRFIERRILNPRISVNPLPATIAAQRSSFISSRLTDRLKTFQSRASDSTTTNLESTDPRTSLTGC